MSSKRPGLNWKRINTDIELFYSCPCCDETDLIKFKEFESRPSKYHKCRICKAIMMFEGLFRKSKKEK